MNLKFKQDLETSLSYKQQLYILYFQSERRNVKIKNSKNSTDRLTNCSTYRFHIPTCHFLPFFLLSFFSFETFTSTFSSGDFIASFDEACIFGHILLKPGGGPKPGGGAKFTEHNPGGKPKPGGSCFLGISDCLLKIWKNTVAEYF